MVIFLSQAESTPKHFFRKKSPTYTYQKINFTKESSWQATSSSAIPEIPHILGNQNVITVFITACPLSVFWARQI